MNLNINIGHQQFLELIAQLPASELERLMVAIQQELKAKKQKKTPLQKLLLQAPTWSEQEFKNFQEAREHLNQFRQI